MAMRPASRVLTLVSGGARSGKSTHALALAGSGVVTFIATAEALDEEMRQRIQQHRAERPAHWNTVEAPLRLAQAIDAVPSEHGLIVDCLTLWLSNHLMEAQKRGPLAGWSLEGETRLLVDALRRRTGQVTVVTNEVGLGVVPPTELGRIYRDALGTLNREVAAVADRVVLMVSGIPVHVR
jgi:adenosylcobinamide kinase/adenosylcobinamide-phosphate guanylyltransferase